MLEETTINAISGGVSGMAVSLVMSPLDVVKTRLQVSRSPRNNHTPHTRLYDMIRTMYQREGVRSFYKGLGLTMFGLVPSWAIYFVTYEQARSSLGKYTDKDSVRNIASSVIAGAINNVFTAPIWTIRTRMQTQIGHSRYRNTFDAISKVIRTEGIQALYRGLGPSMVGLVHVAIQFPLYEKLKKELSAKSHSSSSSSSSSSNDNGSSGNNGRTVDEEEQQPMHHHQYHYHQEQAIEPSLHTREILLASSTSKIIASVVAYPHEVLRSRLQDMSCRSTTASVTTNHHQHHHHHRRDAAVVVQPYLNMLDAMSHIWREEGIRGFYRGITANLLRTVPAAVCTLTTFEAVSTLLRGVVANQRRPMGHIIGDDTSDTSSESNERAPSITQATTNTGEVSDVERTTARSPSFTNRPQKSSSKMKSV